jgi:hypothetical protein
VTGLDRARLEYQSSERTVFSPRDGGSDFDNKQLIRGEEDGGRTSRIPLKMANVAEISEVKVFPKIVSIKAFLIAGVSRNITSAIAVSSI